MNLIEMEKLTNKMLEERKNEIITLKNNLEDETIAIQAALEAMDKATNESDIIKYREAKAEYSENIDAKEMHEKRLDKLKNKPYISELEYKNYISAIYNEVSAVNDNVKQKLAKLSLEMSEAVSPLSDTIKKANSILRILQHDLYRDADRTVVANGTMLFLDSEDKQIYKPDTIHWGMAGVNDPLYKEYTKS